MFLSDEEQKLFNEGIVLSADTLIPSKVFIDDDKDYQFSTSLYATTADGEYGDLHFRVYDGTSEDFDPALTFEDKKVSEIKLCFQQEGDDKDEARFVFTCYNVSVIFFNGEILKIRTHSGLDGLSLIFASKIFFIDIVRILLNSDDHNYSLNR